MMKRERRHAAWLAAVAWLASGAAPAAWAGAAQCAQAKSPAERAICADPDLQARDRAMAQAYAHALAVSPHADELKADQRDWLKQRDACGGDAACLRPSYAQRTLELQGMGGRFDWAGRWYRVSLTPELASASLSIDHVTAQGFRFDIGGENSGGGQGDLSGLARLGDERHAAFRGNAAQDTAACALRFIRVGAALRVEQDGDSGECGAGEHLRYDGLYLPQPAKGVAAAASPAGLFVRGLVPTQALDQALHRLLGAKDYAYLVSTASSANAQEKNLDGNGAQVISMFVPGVACDTKSLLMLGSDGRLWVGLWEPTGSGMQVELRYYTNVAADKHRLPKTIAADQQPCSGETLTIRMMP